MSGPGLFPEAGAVVDHDGRAELFPGFINWEAADALLSRLVEEVAWEQADLVMFGRKVTEPRMSVWYSPDGVDYVYSGARRAAHPFTPAVPRSSTYTGTATTDSGGTRTTRRSTARSRPSRR